MKVVAIDDEKLLLERLFESIEEATRDMGDVVISSFDDSGEAFDFCIKKIKQ